MLRKILIILITFTFLGCMENNTIEKSKFLFNTYINIKVISQNSKNDNHVVDLAFNEIERIEKEISGHSKGSSIFRINKTKGKFIEVNIETRYLLKEALKVCKLTNGSYDITIYPLFKLWGFENIETKKIPSQEQLFETLRKIDYRKIEFKDDMVKIDINQKIELGSFLKGYAIHKAKEILLENGIKNGFISAISSIETFGEKPKGNKWRIGLQNPSSTNEILDLIEISDRAIGVSGDYQTFIEVGGKKYHHILNTKTGYPIKTLKMVVVISENAFKSDLYSTAIFSLGLEKGLKIFDNDKTIEGFLVDNKGKIYYKNNFEKYISKD